MIVNKDYFAEECTNSGLDASAVVECGSDLDCCSQISETILDSFSSGEFNADLEHILRFQPQQASKLQNHENDITTMTVNSRKEGTNDNFISHGAEVSRYAVENPNFIFLCAEVHIQSFSDPEI